MQRRGARKGNSSQTALYGEWVSMSTITIAVGPRPPWVEIEGGCTITAVEHCWHTSDDDCFDTYNYTLTRGPRSSYVLGSGGSFTNTETILRTRGASCARDKGCAADGWEDGPPFGTRKIGEVSRCWAPSTGEEEWLPQSMCGGVDACFKMFDPYEEMQQAAEAEAMRNRQMGEVFYEGEVILLVLLAPFVLFGLYEGL